MKIRANGIDIEVEDSAHVDGVLVPALARRPAVLLIMGLGMQLIAWPPALVKGLEDGGFRVIRFDNRDVGLSTHFDHLGKPNVLWASIKYRLGLLSKPPYALADMAHDALGVLDALQIESAHVVGVSLGVMIAQRVAIAAPKRVISLTSIMSTSGAKHLPRPQAKVLRVLLSRPKSQRSEAVVAHYLKLFKAIGSPDYPLDAAAMRATVELGVQRSYRPVGTTRQLMAVAADITRAAQLSRITSPTLVLHGRADPLVPYACGVDTAKRIAGAKLVGIDGMGHDLPPEPVAQILVELLAHLRAAQAPAAPKGKASAAVVSS